MKKRTYIKVLIIILLSIIFLITFNNKCYALKEVTNDIVWDSWAPTQEGDSTVKEKVGVILGVVRVVGIIVSVATLSIIGIKIMIGSAEEKANYKKVMIPWLIGATMVFAITFVPSLVFDISKAALTNAKNGEDFGSFLEGYDDAARWIKSGNIDDELVIKERREEIQGNSRYWSGYTLCLSEIENQAHSRAYSAWEIAKISDEIKNGKITKENIATISKDYAKDYLKESVEGVRFGLKKALTRLEYQASEWNISAIFWGIGEGVELFQAANTWKGYLEGYNDAIEWVIKWEQKASNPNGARIMGEIERKIQELDPIRYCFDYFNGYYDFLDFIIKECRHEEGLAHLPEEKCVDAREIVACIDIIDITTKNINDYERLKDTIYSPARYPNMITPENINSKISALSNKNNPDNKKPEKKAELKRLQIQKYIWDNVVFGM